MLRLILTFALLISTAAIAATKTKKTGAYSAFVYGFYSGPVTERSKKDICILFVKTDFNRKMGLVIDRATCESRKSEFEYLANVTKYVLIERNLYQPLRDDEVLELAKEVDVEPYYVAFKSAARFKTGNIASAHVVDVEESLSPVYNGPDGQEYVFGQDLACVVYLNIAEDGGDLVGVVMPQSRCIKDKVSSLKGKDITFSRHDLEYFGSRKMISALKTLNRDYFYKSLRAFSLGFKLK